MVTVSRLQSAVVARSLWLDESFRRFVGHCHMCYPSLVKVKIQTKV